MPMPNQTDENLSRDTVRVLYREDRSRSGPRKTYETIILPEGYEWIQNGSRSRTRLVENRDTLFDGNGYLIMSYFGKWINRV